jgi:hypothetical protein
MFWIPARATGDGVDDGREEDAIVHPRMHG